MLKIATFSTDIIKGKSTLHASIHVIKWIFFKLEYGKTITEKKPLFRKKQTLERLEGVGFLQQFEFAAVAEEKSAANSIIIVKNVHLQVLLI